MMELDIKALYASLQAVDIKTFFAGAGLALVLRELGAKAWKEHKRRAAFVGILVKDNGARIYLAWDGPLNTIADERPALPMSPAFQETITEAIRRDANRQTLISGPDERRGTLVYETNKKRTWKRRLQTTDRQNYLFVVLG